MLVKRLIGIYKIYWTPAVGAGKRLVCRSLIGWIVWYCGDLWCPLYALLVVEDLKDIIEETWGGRVSGLRGREYGSDDSRIHRI